jgi:hypothetical protein
MRSPEKSPPQQPLQPLQPPQQLLEAEAALEQPPLQL